MSHTQGRLKVSGEIFDNDGVEELVIEAASFDSWALGQAICVVLKVGGNGQHSNARRLVACWNACDGVSTENLEANDSVKSLADNYNAIKAQRDELLGALKGLLEVADFISENVPGAGWRMAQHKARAVINKAEGKV